MLMSEINSELKILSKIDLGTEEYVKTVNGIAKLVEQYRDLAKLDIECDIRSNDTLIKSRELDLKEKELENKSRELEANEKSKKIDRFFDVSDKLVRNVISVAGIVLPLYVTAWGAYASFEFEREDTITTTMGRGFLNKLLPKK